MKAREVAFYIHPPPPGSAPVYDNSSPIVSCSQVMCIMCTHTHGDVHLMLTVSAVHPRYKKNIYS